jgi:hypothetical protein
MALAQRTAAVYPDGEFIESLLAAGRARPIE